MSLFELCVINILEHKIFLKNVPYHLLSYFNIDEAFKLDMLYLINYHSKRTISVSQSMFQATDVLKYYIDNLKFINERKILFPKLIEGYGYKSTFRNIMFLTSDRIDIDRISMNSTLEYAFKKSHTFFVKDVVNTNLLITFSTIPVSRDNIIHEQVKKECWILEYYLKFK